MICKVFASLHFRDTLLSNGRCLVFYIKDKGVLQTQIIRKRILKYVLTRSGLVLKKWHWHFLSRPPTMICQNSANGLVQYVHSFLKAMLKLSTICKKGKENK